MDFSLIRLSSRLGENRATFSQRGEGDNEGNILGLTYFTGKTILYILSKVIIKKTEYKDDLILIWRHTPVIHRISAQFLNNFLNLGNFLFLASLLIIDWPDAAI